MPVASTTSTTGAASSFASAALQSRPSRSSPSCRPLLPSTSAMSAPARIAPEGGDDLGVGLGVEVEIVAGPAAGAGVPHRVDIVRPLLEGLHVRPRAASAAARPSVSVVLPEDLWVAEMKSRLTIARPPQSARPDGIGSGAPSPSVVAAVDRIHFCGDGSAGALGRKGISRSARATISIASDTPLAPSSSSGSDGHVAADLAVEEGARHLHARETARAETPARR